MLSSSMTSDSSTLAVAMSNWAGMSAEQAQEVYVRQWSSLGALVILLWDFIVSWSLEYKHIWIAPSFTLKYAYVYFRYVPMLTQSVNYYILLTTVAHPPIPTHICTRWFYAQLICSQFCFTAVEGVLMLRVYALYNRSRTVGWSLLSLYILETTLATYFGYRTRNTMTYDEICTAKDEGVDIFIYGAGVIVTQTVIWTLTINKRAIGLNSQQSRYIINLLLRDGAWAFTVVILIFAFVMPYTFFVHVSSHLMFTWPNSFFSIAGCRLIMNMQRLKHEGLERDSQSSSSNVELSTIIGIDDSFDSLGDTAFTTDSTSVIEAVGEVRK
ncbi:hypothetical protein BDQ12DRAFT_687713 [Crucibulum laeve]|uniref:Transmembrane protein n=1 Tax=Crucibulum laeve TaxID=68775 RepID=A0A5C3LS04_9AGAR|nr:hypothetical protein BDQ12DRAFT_687713 [Crucibulum laeve]